MLTLDFEELAVIEVKKEGIIPGKTKEIPKSNLLEIIKERLGIF